MQRLKYLVRCDANINFVISIGSGSLWKGRSWQTKAEPGTARYSAERNTISLGTLWPGTNE